MLDRAEVGRGDLWRCTACVQLQIGAVVVVVARGQSVAIDATQPLEGVRLIGTAAMQQGHALEHLVVDLL